MEMKMELDEGQAEIQRELHEWRRGVLRNKERQNLNVY